MDGCMQSQEGVNDKLWTVEHIDRVSRGVYGLARTRVALSMWTFVFLILWFLFSAQFTWFPWPEDKAEVDPDRFLLNGKTPVEFFREYALHHHCTCFEVVQLRWQYCIAVCDLVSHYEYECVLPVNIQHQCERALLDCAVYGKLRLGCMS